MTPRSAKMPVSNLAKEVFELLRRRGPLSSSQISVELCINLTQVMEVLCELRDEGLVEIRPDRDVSREYSEMETPWGVSRGLL